MEFVTIQVPATTTDPQAPIHADVWAKQVLAAVYEWIQGVITQHLGPDIMAVLRVTMSQEMANSTGVTIQIQHQWPMPGEVARVRASVYRHGVMIAERLFVVRSGATDA